MITAARNLAFERIQIGETASFEHVITDHDVDAFARVSGDFNPLHVDEKYAASTPFGKRVAHGFFLGGLVSQLIGMRLPGVRALILKETLEFKKPVHIGDLIKVEGIVSRKSVATQIIEVDIQISVDSIVTVVGSVLVQIRT